MAVERHGKAALVPVAFQTMSLANSTAVAVNSTCQAASVLHVSVETQNGRYRCDSTAPTLTTGVLLSTAGSPYWIEGYNGSSTFKFQRTTGTCKVSIMAYRYVGGDR